MLELLRQRRATQAKRCKQHDQSTSHGDILQELLTNEEH
jgi:hypothetical protein